MRWLYTLIPDMYFHLGILSTFFIVTVSKLQIIQSQPQSQLLPPVLICN